MFCKLCRILIRKGSAGRPASSDISKKRDGECIVEPSSKRKTIVDSSAERDDHRNARPCSSKQVLIDSTAGRRARGSIRVSQQINALQRLLKNGPWIDGWIAENRNNWYKLTHEQQHLWREYVEHDNITNEIDVLRKRQKPRFAGAAESAAQSMDKW